MRIVFAGTPEFARQAFDALLAAGHDIPLALTQPDRPAGRGLKLMPSAVKQAALQASVPVLQPHSLRLDGKYPEEAAAARQALLDAAPDVMVVAAYGLILPRWVLDLPRHGCLNIHASLLPRWRGAAPIQRAILAGDAETGVTIMAMGKGLDTGPMLAAARTPVGGKTAGDLTDELAREGAALMMRVLDDPAAYPPVVQPETGVTYAAKIDKAESRLDFAAGAAQVARQVRAFNPAPGAWASYGGERIRILAGTIEPGEGAPGLLLDDALLVGCGAGGAFRATQVQRAGKAAMAVSDLLRGFAMPAGTRFDD